MVANDLEGFDIPEHVLNVPLPDDDDDDNIGDAVMAVGSNTSTAAATTTVNDASDSAKGAAEVPAAATANATSGARNTKVKNKIVKNVPVNNTNVQETGRVQKGRDKGPMGGPSVPLPSGAGDGVFPHGGLTERGKINHSRREGG